MSNAPGVLTPKTQDQPLLPTDPFRKPEFKNPSYPQRVHFHEKTDLEETLRAWDQRISTARQALEGGEGRPHHAERLRLYHQMLGARDQLAVAVRRMPRETGDLYHEDKDRLDQALAALERIFRRWEAVPRES